MLSLEEIKKMAESENECIRYRAFLECKHHDDIPIELLKKGSEDEDLNVRQIASVFYKNALKRFFEGLNTKTFHEDNKMYLELPDGYRLIFEDDIYVGRYNPNLAEVI